ncbi:hypothetical protein ABPG72_009694 [Tetrahymena utriculariae]
MDKNKNQKKFDISSVPLDQTLRMKQNAMMQENQNQQLQLIENQQIHVQFDENFPNAQNNILLIQNHPDQAIVPENFANQIKQNMNPRFLSDHQNKIQSNQKINSSQQYNFAQQNAQFNFVKIPVDQQQMKMHGVYQNIQYQNIQNQQPYQQQLSYLLCRQHNQAINLICFCNNCQEYSRLVCLQCITKSFHKDHLNQLKPIEEIQNLDNQDYLSSIGTVDKQIEQIQQKGEQYYDENITDVENQLGILEKEFNEMFKQTRKNILVQISENNSTQSEEMSKALIKIQEMYCCTKLKQAIAQFIDGGQLQEQRNQLEEIIKSYSIIYNSNQLLEELLPKKKLSVNTAKLEQVHLKLSEAIAIMSEITTSLDEMQLKFQASCCTDSNQSLRIMNNGMTIKCLAQNIAVALTQKPLISNQTYNIQIKFLEGDIQNHVCWGVILVKEKNVKDQDLVWVSADKGVFCCFDGDCNQMPNSLQSETKVSQKLECPQFNIIFNQQNKLFKIVSQNQLFKYSLKDPKQIIENEKYYLGIALFKDVKISIKVDL